jgi:hypothetical protein
MVALTLLDNFARRWERLSRTQTASGASPLPSYGDDIQKVMVMAQIVNPGLMSVLAPLTAKREPQTGRDHTESARADVRVRIDGETALLTGESWTVTSRAGKETTAHFRLIAVYVADGSAIQLAHFQSVSLPN